MKVIFFICLLSLLFLAKGYSQGEIFQIGNQNNYVAGVTTEKFRFYAAQQKSQNWCWAACIQMVLSYQGLFVDQCDIVKEAFDQSTCNDRPANCYDIERAAGGWNINGRRIQAYQEHTTPSAHDFINDLAYKYPLIIGLNMPGQDVGHAYVLTAVFYQYDRSNRKLPYKVVLRDPWPENPSRTELSWDDFKSRLNCVTHVTF